ncbi:MAG: hypothetical protein H6Q90_6318 [Deltaproteobacteria bacterium]|nr:hypothetical protein [Deltaproteobacteria bacterium]
MNIRATLCSIGFIAPLGFSASAWADSPKPATADEVAAACKTTATYDKKQPTKLAYTVKNGSKRQVKLCWLHFYLYDQAGAQLGHITLPNNIKIAAGKSDTTSYDFGAELGTQIGDKVVSSIEVVTSRAKFTDGAEFEDNSITPDKRPRAAKK